MIQILKNIKKALVPVKKKKNEEKEARLNVIQNV